MCRWQDILASQTIGIAICGRAVAGVTEIRAPCQAVVREGCYRFGETNAGSSGATMSTHFSAIVGIDGKSRLTPSEQSDPCDHASRQRTLSQSSDATRPCVARTIGPSGELRRRSIFRVLLANWIGGLAALIFLTAVFLAIFCVIGWWHVAYIYAGIMGVVIFLACLGYISAVDE